MKYIALGANPAALVRDNLKILDKLESVIITNLNLYLSDLEAYTVRQNKPSSKPPSVTTCCLVLARTADVGTPCVRSWHGEGTGLGHRRVD